MILSHDREVLISFKPNSIFMILFNPVELNDGISSEVVLGLDMDSAFSAFPDLIHYYVRVSGDSLHANLTSLDFTELYLRLASTLDLNAGPFDI